MAFTCRNWLSVILGSCYFTPPPFVSNKIVTIHRERSNDDDCYLTFYDMRVFNPFNGQWVMWSSKPVSLPITPVRANEDLMWEVLGRVSAILGLEQ